MRRQRRKLEKAGELRFDVELGTDHLQDGFRVEGSGWKERRGSAIVSQPQTRRFYEEVVRWAAERGMLRLFFLRFDTRPIAFVLGLEDDSRLYYVKGGFDVDFRRFGPGVIITHSMIEYAKDTGPAQLRVPWRRGSVEARVDERRARAAALPGVCTVAGRDGGVGAVRLRAPPREAAPRPMGSVS